jgi:PAS domain S-box-containing protein
MVAMMLGSVQPMLIAWGPDLIALYNDAHADLIGDRHPASLGEPLFQTSGDFIGWIEPLFRKALTGEPGHIDQWAVATERSGLSVPTVFSVSLTPITDGGAVGGVLCLATDISRNVFSERRQATLLELSARLKDLRDPRHIVQTAVGVLGRRLGAQRVGYGEVQNDDETILLETSYVDGAQPLRGLFHLDSFGAANIANQRLGRTVAQHDVQKSVKDTSQWQAIETRAFVSVPLIRDGRFRASLYVNFRDPHAWSPIEISLTEDVAAQIWEALERARAEEALRESEARLVFSEESLRLATDAAEVGIWDLDLQTGILTWSTRTKAMFGISPDVPCSMDDFYAGLHPDDRAATSAAFASAIDPDRRLVYDVEYRTVGKEDGIVRWVAAKGLGLFDPQGRCVRALGTAVDITARKAVDEALKRSQDNLVRMFAEMNHRVKNNFQMVASVLQLQARRTDSVRARDQLETAHRRIQVLAELHDSLAAAPDSANVDFQAYLEILCDKLRGSIDDPARVRLHVRSDPAHLDSGVAIPLGFVVNELVTNAIKHAFPVPAGGEINVSLSASPTGFLLEIADGGRGLPESHETRDNGLGMRLVR